MTSDAAALVRALCLAERSATWSAATRVAAQAVRDLAATGVEAVVLGPLALRLATGVLSDPGPVPRVELLVPADRGGPAVRALAAHGWGPAADLALDDALATRDGLALVRPALDDAELTVLWRADPDDLRPEADDGLWARARDLAWGEVEGTVAVPSAADLLALEALARGRHEPEGWCGGERPDRVGRPGR